MKNETLLLVEDDPQAVILLRRIFKKRGFDVTVAVASDGAEALQYLTGPVTEEQTLHKLPALVLLDLDLPKVHGFEVLKRMRAHPRTKTLPVIILTSDREIDAATGYTLGANSFMRKPLDFEEFSRILTAIGLARLRQTGREENN
jgi:DNA-binding response OmpR family regulator